MSAVAKESVACGVSESSIHDSYVQLKELELRVCMCVCVRVCIHTYV